MRTANVNETRVLELSKLGARMGWTQQAIGDDQHCSRQNISLIQERLRKLGKLEDTARRGRRGKAKHQNPPAIELSLEQGIALMIKAFNALSQLPELQAELEKYKRGYENFMETAKIQADADKKRKDQEQAFRLAQQGNIPGVTLGSKITPHFTEHIELYDPKVVPNFPWLLTISERGFSFN